MATHPSEPVANGNPDRHTLWLIGYVALLIALAAFCYSLRLDLIPLRDNYLHPLRRIAVGAMATTLILAVGRLVQARVIDHMDNAVTRYNFRRILSLVGAWSSSPMRTC